MVYTKNLIPVCTGRDAVKAAAHGLPVLHLCLDVTGAGALRRLQASTAGGRSLLGIAELPAVLSPACAVRLAQDIAFEAARAHAAGIFADFERDTPACRAVLRAMDDALLHAGVPLYVPLACGRVAPHAVLTVSTAVSGGSLTAYITSLQGIYGSSRVAAFLQPVSRDFTLPSASPEGEPLSDSDREALLRKTGSQTFFSRELCAKYFTYSDDAGGAHFVLFDDASTLEAKLAQLSGCGVQTVFALWPDAEALL